MWREAFAIAEAVVLSSTAFVVPDVPGLDSGPTGGAQVMSSSFPEPIYSSVAVWDGTYAYSLFGGGLCTWDSSTGQTTCAETKSIYRYDHQGGALQKMNAELETGLYYTTGVWTGRYVYVFGGCNEGQNGPYWGCPTGRIVKYDPLQDQVAVLGQALPAPVDAAASIWTGQYAYIFGGCSPGWGCASNHVMRFDPSTETAVDLGPILPTRIMFEAAVWDGTRAYLFGGGDGSAMYSSIYAFDPATLTTTLQAAVLPQATHMMAAVLAGGSVYLFGGWAAGTDAPSNQILKYDPAGDVLTHLPYSLPSPRSSISAVWDPTAVVGGAATGAAFIFGGRSPTGDASRQIVRFVDPSQSGSPPSASEPDLIVSAFDWFPTNPVADDLVRLNATIRNQGNTSAGDFTVRFELDGSLLWDGSVAGLSAGANATVNVNWTATPGNHTIRVIADVFGQVRESNEANNDRTEAFSVAEATPSDRPDLVVWLLALSPTDPKEGDRVGFQVSVRNVGSGTAEIARVEFYLDGVSAGGAATSPLPPGEFLNFTSHWTAQEGNHTLRAVVDQDNETSETNESNNERSLSFSIADGGAPDLLVVDIDAGSPSEDGYVNFAAYVKNQGNVATGSFGLGFLVDGAGFGGDVGVGRTEAGETLRISSGTWRAVAGTHTITAIADRDDAVRESNETNNNRTESFTVAPAPKPDLVVLDNTWKPSSPVAGNNATFTAWIKNNGAGNAGSFYVRFLLDNGTNLGDAWVPGLGAGTSTNVTSPAWNATQGSHTIRVTADVLNGVNESNETNNEREESLLVAPPPPKADLVVTDISWSPTNPREGDCILFTGMIVNQGEGDAGNFTVHVDFSGRRDELPVSGLQAGASIEVQAGCADVVEGPRFVTFAADSQREVVEENETNNDRTEWFFVGPPHRPDLVLEDISWTPDSVRPGDEVMFAATITNQGEGDAGVFYVSVCVHEEPDLVTGCRGVLNVFDARIEGLPSGATIVVPLGRSGPSSDTWLATPAAHRVSGNVTSPSTDLPAMPENDTANNDRDETLSTTFQRPGNELLNETLEAGTPGLSMPLASVEGRRRAADPRYYEVTVWTSATGAHLVGVPLGSYIPGPVNISLLSIPAQNATVRIRMWYAYDASQYLCGLEIDGSCLTRIPVDPNNPGWLLSDPAGRPYLTIELRMTASGFVGGSAVQTLRIPYVGQLGPIVP